MMQVMQANTFMCVKMRLLRAQTKTAQNDRCKNLHSLLPMTKSIFLGTPPTSNRRKITIRVTDFLLSQIDQENFAQFDFKVAFAMDPRWSICAGIVPRTRITWRLEQLFKSYRQQIWATYSTSMTRRPDEFSLIPFWDDEFANTTERTCCTTYNIIVGLE